jgi:hypothetical protein
MGLDKKWAWTGNGLGQAVDVDWQWIWTGNGLGQEMDLDRQWIWRTDINHELNKIHLSEWSSTILSRTRPQSKE